MRVNGRRRVVITGLGAVTPLGNDVDASWESLNAGQSGAREITHFDASDYPVRFACEVKDFDPAAWIRFHEQPARLEDAVADHGGNVLQHH